MVQDICLDPLGTGENLGVVCRRASYLRLIGFFFHQGHINS